MNFGKYEITFKSDSGLLEELGERLVAKKEVAITELIKNAFDADSPYCRVWYDDSNKSVHILDEGHGLTASEFKNNWMTIATGDKRKRTSSRNFKRPITGAKGLGRFSVRFLGMYLKFNSVAYDTELKKKTLITAEFDWTKFKPGSDIQKIPIKYTYSEVPNKEKIGTHLIVSQLNEAWNEDSAKDISKEIIKLTSPLKGLDPGEFKKFTLKEDPGFDVYFSSPGTEVSEDIGEVQRIFEYSWARLQIDFVDNTLMYKLDFRKSGKSYSLEQLLTEVPDTKGIFLKGLRADIHFFPWRKGAFSDIPYMSGMKAKEWVSLNEGIGIIDHGFRVSPYGYKDDDWLKLSADGVTHRRNWRSSVIEFHFPSKKMSREESLDPALALPGYHQLVGAVFVRSDKPDDRKEAKSLSPSMDRQGFVENEAFEQLADIVRGGIEYLAIHDKIEQINKKKKEIIAERNELRKNIKKAAEFIESSVDIPVDVKKRLIRNYEQIEYEFLNYDKYQKESKESLEIMSLMGVVSGFMTHESRRIFNGVKKVINKLSKHKLIRKDKELKSLYADLIHTLEELKGYLDYTKLFISGIHTGRLDSFKVAPQVEKIIDQFGEFAKSRDINIETEIDEDLVSPPVKINIYGGVLLNLFTNAVKALLEKKESRGKLTVKFKAWDTPEWHVLQIMDNGIGIPAVLRDRIWDPLFSTTSTEEIPLGSGMGLGLPIVRRVLGSIKAKINLIDPPEGFNTCFEIKYKK